MSGELPPELGDLAALQRLSLPLNSLTGSLPPELGALSNLEELILMGNNFTGPIPLQYGGLLNLEKLYLSVGNRYTGCIPAALSNAPVNDLSELSHPLLPLTPFIACYRCHTRLRRTSAGDTTMTTPVEDRISQEDRISRLEGAYEHLATKADVAELRADLKHIATKADLANLRAEMKEDVWRISRSVSSNGWPDLCWAAS